MDTVSNHMLMLSMCILLVTVLHEALTESKCLDRELLNAVKGNSMSLISIFKDVGLFMCMRLCVKAISCRSIEIDLASKQCYLYSENLIGNFTEFTPVLLLNKRSFLKFINEKTNYLPDTCKVNEQCFHTVGKETVCLPTKCPYPPMAIPYTMKLRTNSTNSEFGSTLTLECQNDRARTTTSVCMATGQWSRVDDTYCQQNVTKVTIKCPYNMDKLKAVNICFKLINTTAYDKKEAEKFCRKIFKGNLVILDTSRKIEEMAEYLQSLSYLSVNNYGTFWVDGFYNVTDAQWYTRRGPFVHNSLTYSLQAPPPSARCVTLLMYNSRLVPFECTKSNPFICEYT